VTASRDLQALGRGISWTDPWTSLRVGAAESLAAYSHDGPVDPYAWRSRMSPATIMGPMWAGFCHEHGFWSKLRDQLGSGRRAPIKVPGEFSFVVREILLGRTFAS
jgi:hypothetical protein